MRHGSVDNRTNRKLQSVASPRGGLGWTCPPPLLLDVAPEIDTNPTSFYRGRGRRGVGPVAWRLGNLQSAENEANLLLT